MHPWIKCPHAQLCLFAPINPLPGGYEGKATLEVIGELLTSKKLSNRREIYIQSLKYYLTRFADYRGIISSIKTSDIEIFISKFSGYARQTWLNRISTLFSFAVRRGYINKNPCDAIDRVTIDRLPPVILTVSQARTLIEMCPNNCQSYLILGLFAGIRPDEIHRLDWKDINLQTSTIRVDGKTRRRRIVHLDMAIVVKLKEHAKESGPVAPTHNVIRRWKRNQRAILGGKWTADVLRHTAASYLLARHESAGKVAMMLGNSEQILLTHYHEPVTKEDCEKFWNL